MLPASRIPFNDNKEGRAYHKKDYILKDTSFDETNIFFFVK